MSASNISHVPLPSHSNMPGFFDETPHVLICIGDSSNAKTFWQMMAERTFGDLATSVGILVYYLLSRSIFKLVHLISP